MIHAPRPDLLANSALKQKINKHIHHRSRAAGPPRNAEKATLVRPSLSQHLGH
jgi:hypothetical protein